MNHRMFMSYCLKVHRLPSLHCTYLPSSQRLRLTLHVLVLLGSRTCPLNPSPHLPRLPRCSYRCTACPTTTRSRTAPWMTYGTCSTPRSHQGRSRALTRTCGGHAHWMVSTRMTTACIHVDGGCCSLWVLDWHVHMHLHGMTFVLHAGQSNTSHPHKRQLMVYCTPGTVDLPSASVIMCTVPSLPACCFAAKERPCSPVTPSPHTQP